MASKETATDRGRKRSVVYYVVFKLRWCVGIGIGISIGIGIGIGVGVGIGIGIGIGTGKAIGIGRGKTLTCIMAIESTTSPIVKKREKMCSYILMWISCILIQYRFTNKRRSSTMETIRLPGLAR